MSNPNNEYLSQTKILAISIKSSLFLLLDIYDIDEQSPSINISIYAFYDVNYDTKYNRINLLIITTKLHRFYKVSYKFRFELGKSVDSC